MIPRMQELAEVALKDAERAELERVADNALVRANEIIVAEHGTMQVELAPGTPRDPMRCSLAETVRRGLDGETPPDDWGSRRWVQVRHQPLEIVVGGRAYPHSEDSASYSVFFDARLYPERIVE